MAEGRTSSEWHGNDAVARRLMSVHLACTWCGRRLQLHDADLLNRDDDVACPACHRTLYRWA